MIFFEILGSAFMVGFISYVFWICLYNIYW